MSYLVAAVVVFLLGMLWLWVRDARQYREDEEKMKRRYGSPGKDEAP